jgi:hypothetical protein
MIMIEKDAVVGLYDWSTITIELKNLPQLSWNEYMNLDSLLREIDELFKKNY